jgi:hypothetical protein
MKYSGFIKRVHIVFNTSIEGKYLCNIAGIVRDSLTESYPCLWRKYVDFERRFKNEVQASIKRPSNINPWTWSVEKHLGISDESAYTQHPDALQFRLTLLDTLYQRALEEEHAAPQSSH